MVVVAACAMVPSALLAQSFGSINTYSPYTMYGLGELQTQGSLASRSMGGIGVALSSATDVNILNPASYSSTFRKSMLFSFGTEGTNTFNTQKYNGSTLNNSYASFNFHDISMLFPLAEKAGMSLSVSPYSSVGYKITSSENVTDVGYLSYVYEGGGDITQVNLGAGWEPIKNLSIGASATYYWGVLSRSFTMSPYVVTGYGPYNSTTGVTSYTVSKIMAEVGAQWRAISTPTRILTVGATYNLGGDLLPEYDHTISGDSSLFTYEAESITEDLSLVMPNQIAVGVSHQTPKLLVGLDYVYQNWYTQNEGLDNTINTASGVEVSYNDFSTFKLGAQYTPNRNDARRYFRRVSYRGGLRYGGYQHTFGGEELHQYAITAGASFPLKMNGFSKIDVGLEYGSRGSSSKSVGVDANTSVGLIRQDYVKLSISFTLFGEDYWFQRMKFD